MLKLVRESLPSQMLCYVYLGAVMLMLLIISQIIHTTTAFLIHCTTILQHVSYNLWEMTLKKPSPDVLPVYNVSYKHNLFNPNPFLEARLLNARAGTHQVFGFA